MEHDKQTFNQVMDGYITAVSTLTQLGTKVLVPPPYWCPEMGTSVGKVVSFKSDYVGECVTITSKA